MSAPIAVILLVCVYLMSPFEVIGQGPGGPPRGPPDGRPGGPAGGPPGGPPGGRPGGPPGGPSGPPGGGPNCPGSSGPSAPTCPNGNCQCNADPAIYGNRPAPCAIMTGFCSTAGVKTGDCIEKCNRVCQIYFKESPNSDYPRTLNQTRTEFQPILSEPRFNRLFAGFKNVTQLGKGGVTTGCKFCSSGNCTLLYTAAACYLSRLGIQISPV